MIKLELNREIYSRKNVEGAREAYKKIAKIVIKEGKSHIRVIFLRCKYGEERTVKEFENYLIGIENS
jgi:hypothetical protein